MSEHVDLERDLVLLRILDAPRFKIWRAWTQPVMVRKWFCPPPLRCQVLNLDLRPGGGLVVCKAEGDSDFQVHFSGCFLDVVHEQRLVFTDALTEDFRPAMPPSITIEMTFEDHPRGTAQTMRAICHDRGQRDLQVAKGFYENWEQAFDQLADLARWRRPVPQ